MGKLASRCMRSARVGGPMAVSAFCRKAETAASALTSRHHPCASEQLALYSSHGWTKQRIRIAFVLLDVCWCWKVVLRPRPSPAWGLQRPSCFEHADYDQDVSIKKFMKASCGVFFFSCKSWVKPISKFRDRG